MNDDTLGLIRDPGIAVRHGQGDHLIGAGEDLGEVVRLFFQTLRHSLHDTGMVGAQIDEAIFNSELP